MAADDPKSIGDSRGPYNKLRPTCFADLFSFFAFGRPTLFLSRAIQARWNLLRLIEGLDAPRPYMRTALVYAVDNFLKGVQFVGSDVIAKVGHYIGLGLNHHFRRNISYLQLSSCCIFRTCIEYA